MPSRIVIAETTAQARPSSLSPFPCFSFLAFSFSLPSSLFLLLFRLLLLLLFALISLSVSLCPFHSSLISFTLLYSPPPPITSTTYSRCHPPDLLQVVFEFSEKSSGGKVAKPGAVDGYLLTRGTVRVFNHGFCCVRVKVIGLRLLCGARFSAGICTRGMPLSFAPLLLRLKLLQA